MCLSERQNAKNQNKFVDVVFFYLFRGFVDYFSFIVSKHNLGRVVWNQLDYVGFLLFGLYLC